MKREVREESQLKLIAFGRCKNFKIEIETWNSKI